ncbi:PQ loop repeat-domain-containing protein [Syncephalastrum racemosum]|uniref:PQ loop repeat-domain-containing protein n=1 Tax=Syncephalastrum racemosum TaxID=13706 RepID=A0A1X2HRT9_SYNRA|nr:PQ loop repeat-domain-containing protein [Syncephalastrum racemosum]
MTQECIPPQDDLDYIHWIYTLFGDCVYSNQGAFSVICGYISILCWLNAQLPQVIENYKIGSASSLSLKFLSIWFAGDTANLIGCILTHQLPFQLYLGIYFVFIDCCLLGQWIYYNKIKRSIIPDELVYQDGKLSPLSSAFQHPSVRTPLLIDPERTSSTSSSASADDIFAPSSVSASPSKWYTLDEAGSKKKASSILLGIMLFGMQFSNSSSLTTMNDGIAAAEEDDSQALVIGRLFAWICTFLYLLSRIPQIRKNYKRKSVKGLSPALFVFAACGNLTYSMSILSNPNNTRDSLIEAIPFLIGSAGTLTFDFTIFVQFLWYSRRKHNAVVHHHHRHHHHTV